jgi:hypothetical protein
MTKAMDNLKNVLKMVTKSIGMFERQLWSYALDLYRGEDVGVFIDQFTAAIDNQLTRAWNEGAAECDVLPEDMTEDDLAILQTIIDNEFEYILGLAEDIQAYQTQGDEVAFGDSFKSRIDLWVNRYTETVNRARVHFGGKLHLRWTLGATEKHCETCAALDGIVAWAIEWEQAQIQPQNPPNPQLECGGWKCDCKLEPTDERRTQNALKRLLDIAVSKQT